MEVPNYGQTIGLWTPSQRLSPIRFSADFGKRRREIRRLRVREIRSEVLVDGRAMVRGGLPESVLPERGSAR
jgi:hypothetical protein